MWELSLNESNIPDHFMKQMNEIARERSPETHHLWLDRWVLPDVYIPARQHAKFPGVLEEIHGKMPLRVNMAIGSICTDTGLNRIYPDLSDNAQTGNCAAIRNICSSKQLIFRRHTTITSGNHTLAMPTGWCSTIAGPILPILNRQANGYFRWTKWSYYFY